MGLSLGFLGKKIGDILGAAGQDVGNVVHAVGNEFQQAPQQLGAAFNNPVAQGIRNMVNPMPNPLSSSYDAGRFLLGAVTGNQTAQTNAANSFKNDYAPAVSTAQGFARTVPQIAQTVLHPTSTHSSYHPGSPVEKAIFGSTPVQSIQSGVASNYAQNPLHTNNLLVRGGLAGLYGAGQVAQDLPEVGAALKGVKVGLKGAGATLDAVSKSPLNQALGDKGFISVSAPKVDKPLNPALPDQAKVQVNEAQNAVEDLHQQIAQHQNSIAYAKEHINSLPVPRPDKEKMLSTFINDASSRVTAAKQELAGWLDHIQKLDPSGKSTPVKSEVPDPVGTTQLEQQLAEDNQPTLAEKTGQAIRTALGKPNVPLSTRKVIKMLKAPVDNESGAISLGAPVGGEGPKPKISLKQGEFDPQAYVAEMTKRQEEAANPTVSLKDKAAKVALKAKSATVDALSPIESPINKVTGGFYTPESLHLRNALDRSLRAPTLAGQYARDNGLNKIIQGVDNTKEFDQYLIAKHAAELEKNGVKTGRDLGKDSQLVESLKGKYEPHAQTLATYNHGLLDKAVNYGLISKDNAAFLKKKYPNYVPMERIFNEDELQGAKGTGTSPASLSRQDIVRRIEGSKREVASPLQSILSKTHDLIHQGERSDAARAIVDTAKIEGNPLGVKPLRTAEDVQKRVDLFSQAKELKPVQSKLLRMLKTQKSWAKPLQREIDKLNIKGLDLSLSGTKEAPTLGDAFRYQNRDFLSGAETTAKSRGAKDIGAAKEVSGTMKTGLKIASGAGARETRQLVNSLVNLPRRDIEAINRKISTKENKLGPILDQIAGLSDAVEGVKGTRSALFDEAKLHRDASARNKATISTFKNGIKEIYEVDPAVAEAAKSLSKEQLGFLGKIFAVPTRILRLGATSLNPAFTAANVAKDAMSAFINTSHAARTSFANPQVFLQALSAAGHHGGKEYAELVREGAGGTSFDIGRNEARQSVKLIRSQRDIGTRAIYTVTHPAELLRTAENLIGRSEEFGRASQYFGSKQAALKSGASDEFARVYGADAARNNTTNFSRSGTFGQVLNSTLPYLNAGIQGSRTLMRNLKERPLQTGAKIATVAFLPIAATTAWNISDPARKRAYDNISETEKQNNIIIIPPDPKQDASGRWNAIKIPMSQEIANLGNVVRNGVEAMAGDKNFNFATMAGNLLGTATSLNTQDTRSLVDQLTPQAMKPGLESLVNQNLYTGRQLVPDAQKNLSADQQVNKNTSGTARIIGKLTGQSPLLVDNALSTVGGGLEQNLVHLSDQALHATGVIPSSQIKGKGFIDAMANRFNSAQGQTPGSQFYSTVQQVSSDNHLSGSDYNGLQTILSKGYDGDGNPLPATEKTAQERNTILAVSPKVAQVVAQTAIKTAEMQGKPVDPLYKLSTDQQNAYYKLQQTPYQGPEYAHIASTNASWLQPFEKARAQFFADNPITPGSTPSDRVPFPKIAAGTQQLMDQAKQLTAIPTTQRTPAQTAQLNALYSNPGVAAAFQSIAKYTNDRRVAQGFDPLKTAPSSTPYIDAQIKAKNWKDPQVQSYLNQVSAYNIEKGGSQAIFQGTDLSQAALKGIESLGQYGIVQNPNGQLAVAGSSQAQPGATSQAYSAKYPRTSRGHKPRIFVRHSGGGSEISGSSKSFKVSAKGGGGHKIATAKTFTGGKPKVSFKASTV